MSPKIITLVAILIIRHANADCQKDIQDYIQGLSNFQLWSWEMLDSSVKYPTGTILEGQFLVQLGNFDQCIAVRGPNDDSGTPRFKGKYCHFNFGFQSTAQTDMLNETIVNALALQKAVSELTNRGATRSAQTIQLPFLWAICAPSSCTDEEVTEVANFNMGAFSNIFGIESNSSIAPNSCYYEGDGSEKFDALTWCFIGFVVIVASWICFSSLYELFIPNIENSGWKIFVKSFSLQTNVGDLVKLPSNPAPGQLSCLHGMRVISLMWVILGHTYMFAISFPVINYVSVQLKATRMWSMAPLMNGYLSVDTFFLLGGILVTYVPLVDQSKGRKFNIWKYYIYRYLRITPALAVVTWYLSSLHIYIGQGPMWYITAGFSRTICRENWWPTLLYISNYVYDNCLGQAWYLSVDMQLALLAPIVIIPLLKWPNYGLGLIAILSCACFGAMFGVTYVERFPWTFIMKPGTDISRYMDLYYRNTPLRAMPYLVGMALGYILSKKRNIKLPKWAVALGWFLSTLVCLTIVYSILIVYDLDYTYEPVAAAFYASLHKLGWALGVGWVIWACVNGYGGPVNSILSWKFFLPLSKLSFAFYLVHQDIINFQRGLRRTANYISNFEAFYDFDAYLILCLPVSVLLYLAIEAPIMNLLRSIFRKGSPGPPKSGKKK
ncbi:nose resistant to fluoxetine protein 6-like [Cloeon dipterum]|uniref:nose resistant to fluoxetine protein 6-like n=1 Tax=Cloeon dipterum TaxID=197152 RepID=UPI00321FF433